MATMKAAQAPARWTIKDDTTFPRAKIKDRVIGPACGPQVCLVYKDNDKDEANARLIVNAPELLEALESLVTIYETESNIGDFQDAIERLTERARELIAKAKGES